MSNEQKPMQGLAAWLRAEASRHATSICQGDSAVQAHVVTLRAWATEVDAAAADTQGEPIDYDRIVSICDAHGIGLPVDCVELVVEIVRHAMPSQAAAAAPYGPPFTTDVPQCCGDPSTCDDPCVDQPDERAAFEAAYRNAYPETCITFPDRFKRDPESPDEYDSGSVHVAWVLWQAARVASPSPKGGEPVAQALYVECHECSECGHIGINDSHDTDAACGYSCGWSGPPPIEDKCPGCGRENVMGLACPKCSGRYGLLAEANLPITAAPQASPLTDEQRDKLIAAYNAGWDASDDCDNAYNNGSSEQLSVPAQAQEPEVFQRWRAEWFTNRNEVVTALLAAKSGDATVEGEKAS